MSKLKVKISKRFAANKSHRKTQAQRSKEGGRASSLVLDLEQIESVNLGPNLTLEFAD